MNIFREIRRDSIGWWEREYSANKSDYAAAVVAVMLLMLGIFGPVARGTL